MFRDVLAIIENAASKDRIENAEDSPEFWW